MEEGSTPPPGARGDFKAPHPLLRPSEGRLVVRSRPRQARLVVAAIVVAASFGAGILGAALLARDAAPASEDAPRALAIDGKRVFQTTFASGHVTLGLDDAALLGGFLDGTNLAPGDVVTGRVVVDTNVAIAAAEHAFSLRAVGLASNESPSLADALFLASFTWDGADALGPPHGLAQTRDLDGDGRVSVREFANGSVELGPPRARAAGGTPLEIAVVFDPPQTLAQEDIEGDSLDLAFVFELVQTREDRPSKSRDNPPFEPAPQPPTPPVEETPEEPRTALSVTPGSPDGEDGWYATPPRVTLRSTPSDATILVALDGEAERAYDGPFVLSDGHHAVRHRARGADGTTGDATTDVFAVDTRPPSISAAAVSSRALAPGDEVEVTARASDETSGLDSLVLVLVGPDGARETTPLTGSGAERRARVAPDEPGTHRATLVARDRAGNDATRDLGTLRVSVEGIVEEPPVEVDDGEVLESTSVAGGGGGSSSGAGGATTPGATIETAPPEPRLAVRSAQPDAPEPRAGEGYTGRITVVVENAEPTERSALVVLLPDGPRELSRGTRSGDWDTSEVPSGFYEVEMREEDEDGGEHTIASATILVLHPRGDLQGAAAAIAAGVAVSALGAAAASGSSSVFGALAGRGFDALGFAREAVSTVAEDRVRDKTKHIAAIHQRRRVRSVVALGIAVAALTLFFTWEGVEGWSLLEYVATLPLVGAAAAVFYATTFAFEILLARMSGALTRFRLLVSGILSLAVSSILLRQAFGHAGYVEKDEVGDDERLEQRRLAAFRALAVYGVALSTVVVFLLVGRLWRFDFAEWGIAMALTAIATSAMPIKPLPGHEVWRWNKAVAIVTCLGGFALYVLFTIGALGLDVLAALGVVGGGAYAFALWKLRLAPPPAAEEGTLAG